MNENNKTVIRLLRTAARHINGELAYGCIIVTSTPELKQFDDIQIYGGTNELEIGVELARQFALGRVALAICPLVNSGLGKTKAFVNLLPPYSGQVRLFEAVESRANRWFARGVS
jgi:hypothetical protein